MVMSGRLREGAATLRLCAVAILGLATVGCAKEEVIKSASEMYDEAVDMQSAADYEGAINKYDEIQASHPFGPYAQQSLLNQAHLHYEERKFDEALSSINRFIQEYPAHYNIDYARYLRALSLLREKPSLIDRIFFSDFTNHSRDDAIKAYEAFLELAELHPESRYSPDALKHAGQIVDSLANKELDTALHYLRIGAYGASMSRATDIINIYPDSSVLEPALAVIVASLTEIGAHEPLEDASESLTLSFPSSPFVEPASQGAVALLEYMELDVERGDYVTRFLENY